MLDAVRKPRLDTQAIHRGGVKEARAGANRVGAGGGMNFIVIKTSYPEESTELLIPKPPYIVWDIQDPP